VQQVRDISMMLDPEGCVVNAHQTSDIDLNRNWFTLMQAVPQLCER